METNPQASGLRRTTILLAVWLLLLVGVGLMTAPALMGAGPLLTATLSSIGTFLATAIVLGYLYRVTVRPYDDAQLETKLTRLLEQNLNRIVVDRLESSLVQRIEGLLEERLDLLFEGSVYFGLKGFLPAIDFGAIFDSLNKGDVLWWLDTYDPKHHEWLDNLRGALRRGANVNLLVLSSESPLAELRAQELGVLFNKERFETDLQSFKTSLDVVRQQAGDEEGRLRIVEYDDLIGCPAYIVCQNDEPRRGYSSVFLNKPTAIRFPHFVWEPAEGDFLGQLFEYVSGKWARHEPESEI